LHLRVLVEKQNKEIDLARIWNEQKLYQELENQLAVISRFMLDQITYKPETVNITQWCKRENCWNRISRLNYELDPDFVNTLITHNFDAEKEAKDSRKIEKGINYQTFVIEKGEQFWKEVSSFALKNKCLSEKEMSILVTACNFQSTGRLPSEKQCFVIHDIYDRVKGMGFNG
jgi:hypothetical protein